MQKRFINSLISKSLPGLTTAIRTTFVVTTIRTICCATTVASGPKSLRPDANGGLGHHNLCRVKRTLPKLGDVCVWKPPTRYCQPAWCHAQHGHMSDSHFCKRCYMTEEELLKDPDCVVDDLKEILDAKKAYVIDVRRDDELEETGRIPGAVHIPLDVFEPAMKMDDAEFKKQFGCPKPELDHDHVVINCRSGIRSLTALKIARSLGYHRSKHLPGGFLLWKERYGDMISRGK